MQKVAYNESINIFILSGFRSYSKQYQIIKKKLENNLTLQEILRKNTLPGLSEHHTGNAIDIINDTRNLLSENSVEYKWLIENAYKFGFYLSYPKDNKSGIIFEPWHWYLK